MKHYFFGHNIKGKANRINELIHFVNTTSGNLTIGLSSKGGDVGAALFMLEMLNRHKDRIHLVAAGIIYSSAFDVWLGFRGYKSVIYGTMGMTHIVDTTVRVTEKGYYLPEDEEHLKNQTSYARIAEELTFPVMSANKKAAYEQGKDVFFTYDDLHKIATKHNRTNHVRKPS